MLAFDMNSSEILFAIKDFVTLKYGCVTKINRVGKFFSHLAKVKMKNSHSFTQHEK